MGRALRVDTDLLRALTPELAAIADTAHEELTRLKQRLAAEGECWGDDEPGRVFGDSYEPAAEKGVTGFENLVHNLRGMSSSVADSGEVLQEQDQNIGSQLRNQDPFRSDPVGSGPFDHPRWQSPAPYRPVSTPNAADSDPARNTASPTSAHDPTAAANNPTAAADDPTAAQPNEQPGYRPASNPAAPGRPNPGDYRPTDDPGATGHPNSNPTPSVPDRATPIARGSAPAARTPAAPAPATPSTAESPSSAAPKSGAAQPSAGHRTPETRWTRPPTDSPWMRNAPGTPWSRGAGGPSQGQAFPPRRKGPQPVGATSGKPGKDAKPRKKSVPTEAKRSRVRTDPSAVAAARELALRHGLRITGFDTSGVRRPTVDQIAAAIDGILGKYPFIELAGIEITDLRDGAVSRVELDRAGDEGNEQITGGWILLDRVTLANPALLAEKVETAVRAGERVAGSAERPMYSTIVRDLGRILEAGSAPRVRRSAHRSLLMEYQRVSGPWDRGDTLAAIVRGFRKWRAQLIRACFRGDRFDPRAAIAEAFTEVELRGEGACGPAKVLHRLVVEHARGRSSA
ncbi:WXG100 family type VII secretion target [Nocardia sp. CY41]|uniref:WXG100 family type VII secretion target n=1 Tax=Nocardia sp. CY41 TaxID=2608686 RepID=UPI00135C61B1|nr:WXG100 family type VII secretion target [Nocardia sp. CY41]